MKLRLLHSTFFILAIIGWLLPASVGAADMNAAFDAANKLYEEGKYADAAAAYEKLLQSGYVSDTLYFNLGNACYKAGQNGRAIAAYRRAEQVSPRDPDVHYNLQFVRRKVNGSNAIPGAWWQRWLSRLTLNQWTTLTMLALWLWFVLLALTEWRRKLKAALKRYIVVCGLGSLVLAVCLGTRIHDYYFEQPAIVTTPEAVVRRGPYDESPSAFSALDGVELSILDQKGDWLEVSDVRGRTGWLKRTQVLQLKPNA